MSKFKKSVLIFGALILMIAVALGTFLVLSSMDMIAADPIAVEFTVLDSKKVYDGKPLSADWYYITSGELMKGHSAVVSYSGSITDVGEAESDMTVRIKDEKGYDVTDKYAIKVVGGKLTVTANELTIKLPDTEVTYSGERVEFKEIEVLSGKLGAGHKIVLEAEGGIGVGDRLTFDDEDLKVYDALGNDVSRNYVLDCEKSNLTILPRPVSFAPVGGVVKVYDGMPVSIGRYEIVSGSLAAGQYAEVRVAAVRKYGDATVDLSADTTAVADWGKYELSVSKTDVTIYDKDGNDVTDNYTVTGNTESVEIQRRPLTIGVKEVRKTYDGVAVTPTTEITEGAIASYQTLSGARCILLSATGSVEETLLYADTYSAQVDISSVSIIDREGKDVTENYAIGSFESVSVIERRPLTLSVRSMQKTYDAKRDRPTVEIGGTLASQQILYTDGLQFILKNADGVQEYFSAGDGVVLNEGTYSVSINAGSVAIVPRDAFGEVENFARNYEITVNAGEYTVGKRTVYAMGEGQTFTYNSLPHTCDLPDKRYSDSLLVSGHVFVLIYKTENAVTNVGDEKDNEFDCLVLNAANEEVTRNYYVIPSYGKLTVEPLPFTVTLKNHTATYTGTNFDLKAQKNNLVQAYACDDEAVKETVYAAVGFESVSGEVVCNAHDYVITARLASPWAENCRLSVTNSILTVKPKTVYVSGEDLGFTYGDTPVIDYTKLTVEGIADTVRLSEVAVDSVEYNYADAAALVPDASDDDAETPALAAPAARVYLKSPRFVKNDGMDVTQNYVLKSRATVGGENTEVPPFVTFAVTKRTVKLTVGSGTITEDSENLFIRGGWKQYVSVSAVTPLASGDALDLSGVSREKGTLRYDGDDGRLYVKISAIRITRPTEAGDGSYDLRNFYNITSDSTAEFPSDKEPSLLGFFPMTKDSYT